MTEYTIGSRAGADVEDSTDGGQWLLTRDVEGIVYIDFNSLLTYAMFSARDSPSGSPPQTFTMQTSPQSGEVQFTPAPTHTKKINSFAL